MSSIADRRRKAAAAARAERKRAAAISATMRRNRAAALAEAEQSPPPKGSTLHRLHNQLTRRQYEAGCRFRDDWHDHLDCKVGDLNPDAGRHSTPGDIGHERLMRQGASRAAWDRASAYVLRETDGYVRNRVITVCIGGTHPEAMAKRLSSDTGTPEHAALAGIIGQLKAGLDALGKHYAGEAAPEAA